MTDARAALALAKKTLALVSGADQASVQVNGADAAYSRFARNYVVANLASVGLILVKAANAMGGTKAYLLTVGMISVSRERPT